MPHHFVREAIRGGVGSSPYMLVTDARSFDVASVCSASVGANRPRERHF